MIDLTIVISSYETQGLLCACLASIEKARAEYPRLQIETIVIDNASRDDSVEVARASPLAPRVVALIRNRGFASAMNVGVRMRRGRHVLLLNSDVEIETDVLVRGVEILDAAADAGVLGVALLHSDGRAQRSVHAFPSLETEWLPEPFQRSVGSGLSGQSRGTASPDDVPATQTVEAVRGAVFFIRGALIEKIGLLDERYFFFLEETDYCWRTRDAGYRVLYCEQLHAMHRLGASSKRLAPAVTRIEFHRSLYRFLDHRRGHKVATLARYTRLARNTLTVLGLAVPALVSPRSRSRLTERFRLVLWHLRRRPDEPELARALRLAVEKERA